VLSEEDVGADVVRGVMERLDGRVRREGERWLEEVAYETLYIEQSRLAEEGPDLPPGLDRAFISWLRAELARADEPGFRDLVRAIVEHYVHEIAGHFDRRVYRVAVQVVPRAVSALLHGAPLRGSGLFDVDDRILIEGEVAALQALARIGTVILAPTHVSNLDSLVMGSIIYRLGLPPFAYGAGLNLFSRAVVGFFMRHLGAYTIDRKKTDPLYRATLKEYATVLLARGQHSLLFPGGTRSRSGAVERALKKGLLGTAPAAFRRALEAGAPRPRIFVVPCTLTYPLVLEASTLIADHLRAEGGPHAGDVRDEFDLPRRWLDFLLALRRLDARVHARMSRPLDWLGNEVDERGDSRDARGRPVDPREYLLVGGQLAEDDARDAELTRLLAARVAASYRRDNVALPTSLVALALFEHLRRACEDPNLFRFVRNLGPDSHARADEILRDVGRGLDELRALARAGTLRLGRDLEGADAPKVLARAVDTFATYHRTPVVARQGDQLCVGDPGLLLYYRNRLDGYGLLGTRQEQPS